MRWMMGRDMRTEIVFDTAQEGLNVFGSVEFWCIGIIKRDTP